MEGVRGDVNVLRVARRVEPTEKSAADAVLVEVWESMRPKLAKCLLTTMRSVLFFSHATNIQKMTVPLFSRQGTSVRVEASTGSGKTLAFLLPTLQRLMLASDAHIAKTGLPIRENRVAALVLSPSRTLSRQTFIVCRQLVNAAEHNLKIVTWGDTQCSPETEMKKFNKLPRGGGTIVVATPQSVLEVLRFCKKSNGRYNIGFAQSEFLLIIDEADVVLDKSFSTVTHIHEFIAAGRPSACPVSYGLFGATVKSTPAVERFINERGLTLQEVPRDIQEQSIVPVERDEDDNVIETEDVEQDAARHRGVIYNVEDRSTTLINLRNCHTFVPANQSISVLVHLLNKHPKKKHFIFFNNAETLEYIAELLRVVSEDPERGVLWKMNPYCLHQGVTEAIRSKRFRDFLCDERGILMSTDECAFGIDVREVDYVLHFQPPNDTRVYIHRIGRTGRMGCAGMSVLLLPMESRARLAPFTEELSSAFDSEEYPCPTRCYNAAPLVRNLLAADGNLRDLALTAACTALRHAGDSVVSVGDSLSILGIDADLAGPILASLGIDVTAAAPVSRKRGDDSGAEAASQPAAKKRAVSKPAAVSSGKASAAVKTAKTPKKKVVKVVKRRVVRA